MSRLHSECHFAQLNYTSNIVTVLPIHQALVNNGFRVLIYNGDADACVPYNGNEEWTSSLGYPVKSGWHAWKSNGQVAGYATVYDAAPGEFQFVTVKGSGHMVPQYTPAQALDMFTRFINDQPF
jgi:serine carboxypeptidase-like clade I